jgi:hypothetical protein
MVRRPYSPALHNDAAHPLRYPASSRSPNWPELSFFAANLIRDEGLDYYRTMNRLIGAALAHLATAAGPAPPTAQQILER